MSADDPDCPPGSTPFDGRNWRPAETIDEYLRNCREGLETFSESRAANLMGVPRAHLWRMMMVAEIPEALFDRLLDVSPSPSITELAAIGYALLNGLPDAEIDCCPNCGHVLRKRSRIRRESAAVVAAWLAEEGQ
jgi:hypothetical protein